MPKQKKQEDLEAAEETLEEKPALSARRDYLLGLIEQLKTEAVPVPSQLEVKLAQANKDLGI